MSGFKRRREEIQETTADIFKSETKKGYSNLSFEKVLEYLGIESRELFASEENIPTKDIDDEVVEDISKSLIKLTKVLGVVDTGNESERQEFIGTVLYNVATEYFDKRVMIKKERPIDGEDVKGPVDYIVANKKYILIVIEAKQDNFMQGRAQLLMQLYNAYIENIKNGAPKSHTVYGIVTTGDLWEFIWCEGNNNINTNEDIKLNLGWKYEYKINPIEMDLKKTQKQWKDRVTPLVKKLNYMIDNSLKQFNEE